MKKVAVVFLALALLMTFAALPVMAEPTKGQKVPVTFTVKPMTMSVPDPGYSWYTPGGVFHARGHVETVFVVINIGGTVYNNAFFVMSEDGMWNPEEKTMSMSTDDVLYLPTQGSASGFAGNGHVKLYNFVWGTPPSWTDQTMFHLWHGFGSFEGQTILLSYDGPRSIQTMGWCLKG